MYIIWKSNSSSIAKKIPKIGEEYNGEQDFIVANIVREEHGQLGC